MLGKLPPKFYFFLHEQFPEWYTIFVIFLLNEYIDFWRSAALNSSKFSIFSTNTGIVVTN